MPRSTCDDRHRQAQARTAVHRGSPAPTGALASERCFDQRRACRNRTAAIRHTPHRDPAACTVHRLGARPAIAPRRLAGVGEIAGRERGLHRRGRRRASTARFEVLAAAPPRWVPAGEHRAYACSEDSLRSASASATSPLHASQPASSRHQAARNQRQCAARNAARLSRICVSAVRRSSWIGHRLFPIPYQRTPVWPKPPEPRALASKVSTTCKRARTMGMTTSCAMRSPGWIVKDSRPRFHKLIISGPW
jgi:hypothetical protein